jgi:hypothetical protein
VRACGGARRGQRRSRGLAARAGSARARESSESRGARQRELAVTQLVVTQGGGRRVYLLLAQ